MAALLLVLAASACQTQCETSGLKEILNVEATYVAFPGKHLSSGNYRGLEGDGNGAQGLWVYTWDAKTGDMLAIPEGDSEPCNFGQVAEHRRFLDVGDFQEPRSPVLSLLRTTDAGATSLEFHRLADCSKSSVVLTDAALPLVPPEDHPLPLLLVVQSGKLLTEIGRASCRERVYHPV